MIHKSVLVLELASLTRRPSTATNNDAERRRKKKIKGQVLQTKTQPLKSSFCSFDFVFVSFTGYLLTNLDFVLGFSLPSVCSAISLENYLTSKPVSVFFCFFAENF